MAFTFAVRMAFSRTRANSPMPNAGTFTTKVLGAVIGAALVGALGYQGFAIALGVASVVLDVPAGAIALVSTRLERMPAQEIDA